MAAMSRFQSSVSSRGISALLLFLVPSAAYLYTYPQPNIFYAIVVLLHAVAGCIAVVMLAVVLLRLLRTGPVVSRMGWLLVAVGAVLGLALIKIGTSRSEWNWLYLHIVLSIAGVGFLLAGWAGKK